MEKIITNGIKRIVIIGPESTGKTELTEFLARHFNTVHVPEYAREYIENLDRNYNYSDVEKIAKKQLELEKQYLNKAENILFYDTFLIITKVWFQVVYQKQPKWLEESVNNSHIDLYLLCDTEIPWIEDPVRENGGEMREKLFDIYKNELENYGFNYEIVTGTGDIRFQNALKIVNNFLEK